MQRHVSSSRALSAQGNQVIEERPRQQTTFLDARAQVIEWRKEQILARQALAGPLTSQASLYYSCAVMCAFEMLQLQRNLLTDPSADMAST